jgi:catechol 2,3-dioxygenase-like lactoylglutathione lyase family enzyme
MKRVTGIGGIFFRAKDPQALNDWYVKHLGLPVGDHGAMFEDGGLTIWSTFPEDTPYFGAQNKSFMVNYRVDDLDALLETLRAEGVWIDEHREDHEYGRFAWIADPEGNRIELWQPAK